MLVCLALLGGCAVEADDEVGASDEPLTVYPAAGSAQKFIIKPSDTALPGYGAIGDSATWGATWAPNRDEYVYRPAVSPFGSYKLVLFLPGCGGQPQGYQTFMEFARGRGFHVIGLDYPNPCGGFGCDFDDGCYTDARQEVAFADAVSGDVPLDGHPQDAINKRLKAMLLELESRDPYGQWGQFLDHDPSAPDGLRPVWLRIVTSGHSLGAGYAAFLAKRVVVSRVVMIASPADAIDDCTGQPDGCIDTTSTAVSWLGSHVTPSSVYYGLVHTNDVYAKNRYWRVVADWNALGVGGARFERSETCYEPTCSPHSTVIGNQSLYGDEWTTMLGSP